MPKFIRTKDGRIVDTENAYEPLQWAEQASDYALTIKEADTIEELCDEFVYIKDGIASQYLTIDFKFKRDDEFCALRNKLTANGIAEISKGISKYELENGELKFAIWTDKGLIYVAKMNENGKLELI